MEMTKKLNDSPNFGETLLDEIDNENNKEKFLSSGHIFNFYKYFQINYELIL